MTSISTSHGTQGPGPSRRQLEQSLAFILNAGRGDKGKQPSAFTRVTEQQMFAAIVHGSLKERGEQVVSRYEERFTALLERIGARDPANAVFEAARRALRRLRLTGMLPKEATKELRHFAVGKAQFDSKRDELATRNVTGVAGDTALRAMKTALTLYEENQPATREEMHSFRANNSERRLQQAVKVRNTSFGVAKHSK